MNRILSALGPLAFVISAAPALAQNGPGDPGQLVMAPQDLVTLKRIAEPASSPDGKWVVWQQTDTDPTSYKRTAGLWRVAANGGVPERIADLADAAETSPAFSPDGKSLYFLSGKSGSDQLWVLDLAAPGAKPVQASAFKADIGGFLISPDGKRIIVWGDVARDCPTLGCEKDGNRTLPGPGTGRLYQDGAGFVRHWDAWETPGNYSRGFVFALGPDGGVTGEAILLDGRVDLPGALTGDVPTKPFGGTEELAWQADSSGVYFAARKADRDEPTSTNIDIYHAALDGTAPQLLTGTNKAADTLPAASPDGKWLAWAAMARPGYEADRLVVQLLNLKTGEQRALTQSWDRSVESLGWTPDSRYLIATAEDVLDNPAFRIDPATGKIDRLKLAPKGLGDGHIGKIVALAGGRLLFTRDSVAGPAEVFIASKGKPARQISHANDAALAALAPLSTTRFSFTGANGDIVWGQIHKPANAGRKLPVVLMIHGGPQGTFGDSWSFRWNPRLWAAQGYGVVTIDFHGSTGYGQAFTDAINRDWGGKPLEDLKLGLAAALASDAALDGSNACAAGGSYGGYMTNWIAGQWPDRFKCLIQHDGVFDARAMAYETEELWFDEWEHGGHPYYEAPAEFEKWNPVNHVGTWKTPMLVITSENDFRIPYTQGLASFTALQRRGVPAQLLVFPDENHWVLKPRNSLQWHGTVFDWLARWLKPAAK